MEAGATLPIAFLVFGALVILMEIVVLYRKNQGFGPQAVRIVGVTIVLTFAVALAASTLSVDRLTAIIGLLGTLAGYLAGRGEARAEG